MEDLQKINSLKLYSFWKNLSIGLLVLIAMMGVSQILPFYASPFVSFLAAIFLYISLYNNRQKADGSCMIVIYALLYSVINYTVVTVVLNILNIWNLIKLPDEFLFLNDPYLPTLLLNPICTVTMLFIYLRRDHLGFCNECKLRGGNLYERGKAGALYKYESFYQIKNLFYIFFVLSVIIWVYYEFIYIHVSVNSRDTYVFSGLTIIAFIVDEVYFIYRYYNLYLDLKENDEIITQDELNNVMAKTYLRYYVICGNMIYLDPHSIVPGEEYKEVLDTPFITRRAVNGIPLPEVREIIQRLTGVKDGELRFFFGRKSAELQNRSLLRYFYFLDGKKGECPELNIDGEWINFDEVKRIYTRTPGRLAPRCLSDISRIATIMLTEKIFDENGKRKLKLKSYTPSFSLIDLRNSQLDFQDDKWIKISMFNSDTPLYSIKKLFKRRPGVR